MRVRVVESRHQSGNGGASFRTESAQNFRRGSTNLARFPIVLVLGLKQLNEHGDRLGAALL